MKFFKGRRFYVILAIAVIISLFMVLPMLLGVMGYDIFNRRPVSGPLPPGMTAAFDIVRQWFFYFILVFLLLAVNTVEYDRFRFIHRVLSSLIITVFFYIIFSFIRPAPAMPGHMAHEPGMSVMPGEMMRPPGTPEQYRRMEERPSPAVDMRRLSEFMFIFITTVLAGKVLELVDRNQRVVVENERLRTENLQNRYDLLAGQMNPHFFFNSLNSLSSLVRDKRNEHAVKYIDELSNTYRYIMQNSGRELVTVEKELASLSAYCYLLQIRFEEKLFFDIRVDEEAMNMAIPALSLQPLMENVVKHNVISMDEPFTVSVRGDETAVTITNPVRPRVNREASNGIGLKNLASRYRMLTGKEIVVESGKETFRVILPLIKPGEQ